MNTKQYTSTIPWRVRNKETGQSLSLIWYYVTQVRHDAKRQSFGSQFSTARKGITIIYKSSQRDWTDCHRESVLPLINMLVSKCDWKWNLEFKFWYTNVRVILDKDVRGPYDVSEVQFRVYKDLSVEEKSK